MLIYNSKYRDEIGRSLEHGLKDEFRGDIILDGFYRYDIDHDDIYKDRMFVISCYEEGSWMVSG